MVCSVSDKLMLIFLLIYVLTPVCTHCNHSGDMSGHVVKKLTAPSSG